MKRKTIIFVLALMAVLTHVIVASAEPFPDGTQHTVFDDGRELWGYPDGSSRTVYPEGWNNFVYPGGRIKNALANGHIVVIYRPSGGELYMRDEYSGFREDVFDAYMPMYSGFDEFCIQLRGGETIVGESSVVYDDVFLQFTALGPAELNLNNINIIAPSVVHETISGHPDASNVVLLLYNGSLHINVTGDNSIRGQILILNGELTVSGDGTLTTDTFRYADGIIESLKSSEAPNLDAASDWARAGIQEAFDKGFIPEDIQSGYKNIITRQEFCRMAVKWLEYSLGKNIDAILSEKGLTRDPNAFTDTSDPDILAAFALGITNGTGNNQFTPNGQFNREQAATMIRNTCKASGMDVSNVTDAGFKDTSTASTWAVDGINFVRNAGIMQGTGNDNYSPKATYAREQSIITFNNIR